MNELPKPDHSGKVHDSWIVENGRIIAATNRISALDFPIPDEIPGKGKNLKNISNMWFEYLEKSGFFEKLSIKSQNIATDANEFPEPFKNHPDIAGRAALVKNLDMILLECIARGHIVGSGWKDYQKTGKICGHELPEDLELAQKLPKTLFTPSTKAPKGEHDENITVDAAIEQLGEEIIAKLEKATLTIFKECRRLMKRMGIIVADTKVEFGKDKDGNICLADEVLTPDSSRFWPEFSHETGKNPKSLDKQPVRDWLKVEVDKLKAKEMDEEQIAKNIPPMPQKLINRMSENYVKIAEKVQAATQSNILAVILMGSGSDKPHAMKIKKLLNDFNIPVEIRVGSAHRTPTHVENILTEYDKTDEKNVFITIAGRSNGLSAAVGANTVSPSIACPPFADKIDMMTNIQSTLQSPGGCSFGTVLDPKNVAFETAKILAPHFAPLAQKVREHLQAPKDKVLADDAAMQN